MAENEFFLRKAIGWALREYAKTDPEEVLAYVTRHRSRLSRLSQREALRRVLSRKELRLFLAGYRYVFPLTVREPSHAFARSAPDDRNKGKEAADAAVEVTNLLRKLDRPH